MEDTSPIVLTASKTVPVNAFGTDLTDGSVEIKNLPEQVPEQSHGNSQDIAESVYVSKSSSNLLDSDKANQETDAPESNSNPHNMELPKEETENMSSVELNGIIKNTTEVSKTAANTQNTEILLQDGKNLQETMGEEEDFSSEKSIQLRDEEGLTTRPSDRESKSLQNQQEAVSDDVEMTDLSSEKALTSGDQSLLPVEVKIFTQKQKNGDSTSNIQIKDTTDDTPKHSSGSSEDVTQLSTEDVGEQTLEKKNKRRRGRPSKKNRRAQRAKMNKAETPRDRLRSKIDWTKEDTNPTVVTPSKTVPDNAFGRDLADGGLQTKDLPEQVPVQSRGNSQDIAGLKQEPVYVSKSSNNLLDSDKANQETDAPESNSNAHNMEVPKEETENISRVELNGIIKNTTEAVSDDVEMTDLSSEKALTSGDQSLPVEVRIFTQKQKNGDSTSNIQIKDTTDDMPKHSSGSTEDVTQLSTENVDEQTLEKKNKSRRGRRSKKNRRAQRAKMNKAETPQDKLRSKIDWTKEEDEMLDVLVMRPGVTHWGTIALEMNRTAKECQERWHGKSKEMVWTEEEDRILEEAVAKYDHKQQNWSLIAESLPERSEVAIRDRWCNTLKRKREADDCEETPNKRGNWASSSTTSATDTSSTVSSSIATSAIPTSAIPTSAIPTSTIPTSAIATSAIATSAIATSAIPTSAIPTSVNTSAPTSVGTTEVQPTTVGVHLTQDNKDQQRCQLTQSGLKAVNIDHLRKAVVEQLVLLLPEAWVARVSVDGAYALRWAPGDHCAVQRAVYASFDGLELKISVHSRILPPSHNVYLNSLLRPPVQLSEETVSAFAQVVISAVVTVQEYKLCSGIPEYVDNYTIHHVECRLDDNLFREGDSAKTLRTTDCGYLVKFRGKRCKPCQKCFENMKYFISPPNRQTKKKNKAQVEKTKVEKTEVEKTEVEKTEVEKTEVEKTEVEKTEADESEVGETEVVKTKKVRPQKNKIDIKVRRVLKVDWIARSSDNKKRETRAMIKERFAELVPVESLPVDKQLVQDLEKAKNAMIKERIAKLVGAESLPVDKQLARDLESAFSDAKGIIKLIWEEQNRANVSKRSPSVKWHPLALRWALKKKSSETAAGSGCIRLTPQKTLYEYFKEGVQDQVVKRLSDEVGRLDDEFKKYYVLVFDEMCVLRNIVYHKATGRITGYVNLNQVEEEVANLEEELAGNEDLNCAIANTMLTYFVKGVASGVRGVVAGFATEGALTENQLYTKTWDVIWDLEVAGVMVIALVGDGSALCQAFFDRHTPFSAQRSGVVFDTVNTYANGRPIFFFNDTGNLLKLIRNCFANSGAHKKTRLLMKNGETITWETIVKIFQAKENHSHKLKSGHVLLNSLSVKEVFIAAQVMSKSVADCIEQSKIPNTAETVKFIRFVNDFYDCLNGSSETSKNEKLVAYRKDDDSRFAFLLSFLRYLDEWKREIDALPISETEKQKRKLSAQTLVGIERTTKSFISVVRYLLDKRTDVESYIVARIFQQDDGL